MDIGENEKCVPSVYIDNDTLVFQAILEDMDDEVYYLRLDVDWLEMLDIHVITSKKKRGDGISFSASISNIGIYPYPYP